MRHSQIEPLCCQRRHPPTGPLHSDYGAVLKQWEDALLGGVLTEADCELLVPTRPQVILAQLVNQPGDAGLEAHVRQLHGKNQSVMNRP